MYKIFLDINLASGCNNGDAWPGVVAQIFLIKCFFPPFPSILLFSLIVQIPTKLKITWLDIVLELLCCKVLIGVFAACVVIND